jgi:hypothetical protein
LVPEVVTVCDILEKDRKGNRTVVRPCEGEEIKREEELHGKINTGSVQKMEGEITKKRQKEID